MGCFHSKKDSGDIHPNVFRVMNIDEHNTDLWSGQLEITETDLILYREGRDATVWPLASLRRYGFDRDVFSFESGRRCATGEGIYAFRCRRAGLLFRTLQQNIQLRNVIQDSLPFQVPPSLLSNSPSQPRQTLQASVVHRSSVDNGMRPLQNTSRNILSRTPSNSDILEVMPLYPRDQNNSNHVSNLYQLKEFKSRENNNNHGEGSNSQPDYTNDINRDLAILRKTLKRERELNSQRDEEDEQFFQNSYMNELASRNNAPLSPTLSVSSEHYAQLSVEEAAAKYVNFSANGVKKPATSKPEPLPSTPLTPKAPEYFNLGVNPKGKIISYANLSLGEAQERIRHHNLSEHHKFSESDTYPSMSPVEELELSYAILDIDSNRDRTSKHSSDVMSPENQSVSSRHESTTSHCSGAQGRGRHLSQSSLEKSSSGVLPGYTTIDFEKTVALTSVAADADSDLETGRITRHSISCSSPSAVERTKVN